MSEHLEPEGSFVDLDGEPYYRIAAYDRMPSFLMTLASDADLWMFVTSRGGLTAGRVDANGALFPYETVDKLHHGHHHTGPITLFRVRRGAEPEVLWEPFRSRPGTAPVDRNLYKNTTGTRLVFEEIHRGLDLVFRARWTGSDDLGWVRTAQLVSRGATPMAIRVLDGLRNLLPFGAPLALYQQSSSLVDAYKRVDVDPETGLGIIALTARIVDRAEASEELRANTVWCQGLDGSRIALSADALDAFRDGKAIVGESVLTGRRVNYLLEARIDLEPGKSRAWHLVADVGRDHAAIADLRIRLRGRDGLWDEIARSLDASREALLGNVGSADGLQRTGDEAASVHHLANVLFNNMRGGVFAADHDVPRDDLAAFLSRRNVAVAERHRTWLKSLPGAVPVTDLLAAARVAGDADLERLCHEYLPITFGRRHGDPSRPWNRFSIRLRNPDGTPALRYEGNWRDIFQNWEALSLSFPRFLPGIIAKFVNASTVDGFNPYRITRDGVDWEVEDPEDPWSYIGYWGDHQIIYLLKFLEALPRVSPGTLEEMLERRIFSYANVPYRLAPYPQILRDPRSTISYDAELADRIEDRVSSMGTDGRLLPGGDDAVHHVTLLEKLLVPVLSKLSNLVPGGGIWMNTQRPEWNDANNALVGNGLSVVTLCYLRRYLVFLEQLLGGREGVVPVSAEVVTWLRELVAILGDPSFRSGLESDRERRRLVDSLGTAFSDYRERIYAAGFSGTVDVAGSDVAGFCRVAREAVDASIQANRRDDGLYHAYNLIDLSGRERAGVNRLYEMLEGQVAALSSGVISAAEAIGLVEALFESRMYRPDQKSFLLYPERELPSFLDRNVIPAARVGEVSLLGELIEAGESSVVIRDALGVHRFHPDFRNAGDLAAALDRLGTSARWRDPVVRGREAVLDVFEEVFRHHAYTGRSGTMYGYEGLGCIYWHMVAKLLLAVQEIALRAVREGEPAARQDALVRAYYRIRSGLGFEKSVVEYGAFPMDPYSHTPGFAGAQQPGMTGQVKEEILTRFGELGVGVDDGRIRFRPVLLRRREFITGPGVLRTFDRNGVARTLDVPSGSLAFTFCGTPVRYERVEGDPWIRITTGDGTSNTVSGDELDAEISRRVLNRAGAVLRIEVGIPANSLRD